MIRCFILTYGGGSSPIVISYLRDTSLSSGIMYQAPIAIGNADSVSSVRASIEAAITAQCAVDVIAPPDEFVWLVDTPSTAKQKFFKTNVAGGAGVATFYTDTNGDGTGDALYPSLSADQLSFFVDGVTDQYAFPTITVAGNKKSVTVTAQRQNFTTGNVLLNLLGSLATVVNGVTYVNAANGVGVKMIIGIDD